MPERRGVCQRGDPLARWNVRCTNVAVPLTRDVVERVGAAQIAVGVQRALIALGYDAGPLGVIDQPRAIAAIEQVQRDMGWPVTGKPTPCSLGDPGAEDTDELIDLIEDIRRRRRAPVS